MVSQKSVNEQLKKIGFSTQLLGKAEVGELPNILHEDEEIFECVNGLYEGGFALLCATNMRLLLIDKKPLRFLTVEDLRFDMINQIDYSHRIMGARINISTGSKNLKFTSYNQQRLRKLINHIQHRMSEIKKEQSSSAETQQQHLEKINQQLQAYLLAQHHQQMDMMKQLESVKEHEAPDKETKPDGTVSKQGVKPSPELADYLYAQGLLREFGTNLTPDTPPVTDNIQRDEPKQEAPAVNVKPVEAEPQNSADMQDLVEAGRQEIFGTAAKPQATNASQPPKAAPFRSAPYAGGIEVNALRIAYSKLPMVLRNRSFGRPFNYSAPRLPSVGSGKRLSPDVS